MPKGHHRCAKALFTNPARATLSHSQDHVLRTHTARLFRSRGTASITTSNGDNREEDQRGNHPKYQSRRPCGTAAATATWVTKSSQSHAGANIETPHPGGNVTQRTRHAVVAAVTTIVFLCKESQASWQSRAPPPPLFLRNFNRQPPANSAVAPAPPLHKQPCTHSTACMQSCHHSCNP